MLEVLANGGSALVEWRLETGRTHQVACSCFFVFWTLSYSLFLLTIETSMLCDFP